MMLRYFVILIITTTLFACPNNENCPRQSLIFQIPISLTPALDTFNIGDTIWIESEFPNEILDTIYQERFILDSVDFFTVFLISQIDTSPFLPAQNKFELFHEIGEFSFSPITNLVKIEYSYIDFTYSIKFGLIPNDTGQFYTAFSSVLPEDHTETIPDFCHNARVGYIYHMNNLNENNYHMIDESPDSIIKSTTEEIYNNSGGYCFVVR